MEAILKPLIFLVENYFLLVLSLIPSPFFSIIISSLSISFLLMPITKIARTYENKINSKIDYINRQIKQIPKSNKGEERFRAVELIYNNNNFHPIQNIYKGLSLYLILPILISVYFFFMGNLNYFNVEVFGIFNLSQPDNLIHGNNLLPILIFIINFTDSRIRILKGASGQNVYLIISIVICFLIYSLPSCMTLYWTVSSLFSLFANLLYKNN